ncbi:hypothetical protein HYR99_18350 [Candidatus Poribacteria bacterium]|nr:hypothetical protein [Candidatus Poribacteria bacterium]
MNHARPQGICRRKFFSTPPLFFLLSLLCSSLFNTFARDAQSALNASSDQNGITVEFALPELVVSTEEHNGVRYQAVSYAESGFTTEAGNPRIPVSRLMLGVPVDVNFHVEVISATSETRLGYRLPPTPYRVPQTTRDLLYPRAGGATNSEDFQTLVDEWREDGDAYQKAASYYPQLLAQIVYEGIIRSQRVVYLELHPIQYQAGSRSLKVYPRMVVRVHFTTPSRPPIPPRGGVGGEVGGRSFSGSLTGSAPSLSGIEPDRFEWLFQSALLNYDDAKRWRVPTSLRPALPRGEKAGVPSAPTAQQPLQGTDEVRYKLLVDKTGVYRLTSEDLRQKWGIDLRGVDPRYLHLRTNNREVPIYIHGEADGRFDRGDYIEFLGLDAKSRYTLWNVYWLSVERTRGMRVSEINGSPDDPTAKIVPVFRSKLQFEEDHLHSVLQHVQPEDVSPEDKHGWFDAVDFWYWTGIKNSSDFNEVALEFPLYDLTQSFVQPKIRVVLQGGTPTQHDALVSINGVRIDEAKWFSQNVATVNRTLRVWDNLRDITKGEKNALTMARIDTTTEEDTTRYPYHIYINSFEVEYTRLLKAVNDSLDFISPAATDPYAVRKRRKLEYTVETFLSPDVEVFEHDGDVLVSKLQNPQIEPVNLDTAERDRLRAIFRETDAASPLPAGKPGALPLRDIPRVAYNATFQTPDSHDARFIAVSSTGVRAPVRVEVVPPNDLLSTANGADYLIISHPVFFGPSQRLAEWRSSSKGGGFRAKVIDVTQIYNLFSNGMVSPKAIKEFLKYAYENWQPPALSYVVIMGDGTYDFRGVDKVIHPEPPEVMGYIPTHYIWTTSFGQTAIDHWYTTVSGIDELPDFFIGRLSAETLEGANDIVDKITNYEGNRHNGSWRRQIISVADDEINNSGDFIFKKSLTEIAQGHTLLGYDTVKIFLEDVIKMVKANPAAYPGKLPQRVAKDMVIAALSQGGVIAQYAGHGGRIVWAHEAIFDNASVDLLEQTDHLPFMLVLSCYNGYFDAPGEPSMAEKMLRKRRGGIIGMLSATRLTYGSGNDSLNRIIFDALFKRNVRELGEISFNSKVEQLMMDGLGQLDVMMEYTLFGDPAMKLAMADYEMQPQVETKTVAPGQVLKIAPGQVLSAEYAPELKKKQFTPLSDFNGKLQVKAIFPGKTHIVKQDGGEIEAYAGDVVVTQEAQISNGRFPAFSISVPQEISAGDAYVEYYAENATQIAVGGASFTVLIPKILDIQPELVTEIPPSSPLYKGGQGGFRISTQISDELGSKGIKDVVLEWRDPVERSWFQVKMLPAPSRGEGWYTLSQPLPLPANGAPIKYQITVTDLDAHTTTSDLLEYRPFVLPNVRVVATEPFSEALISYGYSHPEKAWMLNADIEQVEENPNTDDWKKVEVAFFEGNPDRDGDNLVDANAKLLGKTQIAPTAWQRKNPLEPHKTSITGQKQPLAFKETPLNTNWIATATIRYELPLGDHEIFIVVDPDFEAAREGKAPAEPPDGSGLREGDETDNISSRRIQVHGALIGGSDVRVFSQDAIIDFWVPAHAVTQPAVLTMTPVNSQQQPKPVQQPSLKPITLPNGSDAVAYSATLDNKSANQAIRNPQLNQPITAEIRFDLAALKASVQAELGLTEISALAPDQIVAINEGAEQQAKEIGMYLWVEALGKWVRLSSELVKSSNGAMQTQAALANLRQSNHGNGEVSKVEIAPQNGGARIGKWILLFTSPNTYRVLISEDGKPLEEINPNRTVESFGDTAVGRVDNLRYDDGVAIGIKPGEKAFRFGDVMTFEISRSNTTGDESPTFYASSFREQNRGDGPLQYIHLENDSTALPEQWVLLFTDSEHFRVEGQKTGILSQNGQLRSESPQGGPVIGKVGEEFAFPEFGLTLKILAGKSEFHAGDSFRFETQAVGRIRAEVPMLGTLTLMRSNDAIPPDLQLTVGKQNFVSGDPVSSEPLIQATLTDDNGIDYMTRPIRLEISQNLQPVRAFGARVQRARSRWIHDDAVGWA